MLTDTKPTQINILLQAQQQREERRSAMIALRDQGWTLQRISDQYGISRERVRQIIQAYPRTLPAKPDRQTRKQQRVLNRYTAIWNMVNVGAPDACWPWTGKLNPEGYGVVNVRKNGKSYRCSHRVVYLLFHGEIPEGKFILHACGNAYCCNPKHLYAGDAKQNAEDRARHNPHWLHHLTHREAEEIRAKSKTKSTSELALEYGVSYGAVHAIIKNRSHRNRRLPVIPPQPRKRGGA